MATPHAAGVVARCYATGECARSKGAANRQLIIDSMRAKFDSDEAYRWSAESRSGDKYYGPWVWAARW